MADRPLAALDTETTSLLPTVSRQGRRAWEFGAIRREFDTAQVFVAHVEPSLSRMKCADPEALRIGGYYERAPWGPAFESAAAGRQWWRTYLREQLGDTRFTYVCVTQADGLAPQYDLALRMRDFLRDATIVGSNPEFDREGVSAFLHDAGLPAEQLQPWHYKPYDIAAHGSGVHHEPGTGPSTAELSRQFDIERPVEHTALADAAWALAMHDAIEAEKAGR